MTTVAARITKDRQLHICADTKATNMAGYTLGTTSKLQRLESNCIIGYAGAAGNVQLYKRYAADKVDTTALSLASTSSEEVYSIVLEWYMAVYDTGLLRCDPEEAVDIGCQMIIASPVGLWTVHSGLEVLSHSEFAAIGSGASYALGAMYAGASVGDALNAAHAYDSLTNNNVETFCFPMGE